MSAFSPHEIALVEAIRAAMEAEQDDRVQYTFPVTNGRIVIDAAFIPTVREPAEKLRLLPDPPRTPPRKA